MARTVHKETRRDKKGESDAHKVRRSFKEQMDILKDWNGDELEDYDYEQFNQRPPRKNPKENNE